MLDASVAIRQQVKRSLDNTNVTDTRRYRTKKATKQAVSRAFEFARGSTMTKVHTNSLIPSLLQTIAYREAILDRRDTDKSNMEMQLILRMQDFLWNKHRQYHFVIGEPALYTLPGSRVTQAAQLDRLDRVCDMTNVKIGIIATRAGLMPVDDVSFSMRCRCSRQSTTALAVGE